MAASRGDVQEAREGARLEELQMSLRAIMRSMDLHSRFLIAHYGVTGPQLILLRRLERGGPTSITELCRAITLGQATMTGILDRLARRQLIERQRSVDDKRKTLISITGKGRDVLATSPPLFQDTFSRHFADLEDWEQTLILSTFQRVAAMMDPTAKTADSH